LKSLRYIYDSSAVLAIILNESGAEFAASCLHEGGVSCVNQTEIMTRLIDLKWKPFDALRVTDGLGLQAVAFDEDIALYAAMMRNLTRAKGLSLGDRACLATAQFLGATAITADRAWLNLKLPCPIKVIR
jgi:ribonuclease VapC